MGGSSITFYPFRKFKGSATKVVIALSTGGIHKLTSFVSYRCPCVDLVQLPPHCHNNVPIGWPWCVLGFNFLYGVSFAIAPAIGLFLLGLSLQPSTWQAITGWLKRAQRDWGHLMELLSKNIGLALISPVTWVCLTMLDGEHLSCAITPFPYDVGENGATYSSCREAAESTTSYLTNSNLFLKNQAFFQLLGFFSFAAAMGFGFLVYACEQCRKPLTYYHDRFNKIYQSNEMEVMEEKMEEKAKKMATHNVSEFLEAKRDNQAWDNISSIVRFQYNRYKSNVYTPLQKWAQQQKNRKLETKTAVVRSHEPSNA